MVDPGVAAVEEGNWFIVQTASRYSRWQQNTPGVKAARALVTAQYSGVQHANSATSVKPKYWILSEEALRCQAASGGVVLAVAFYMIGRNDHTVTSSM